MGLWSYLFDDEIKQRDDIDALELGARAIAVSTDSLERRVGRLTERLDRLEPTADGSITPLGTGWG